MTAYRSHVNCVPYKRRGYPCIVYVHSQHIYDLYTNPPYIRIYLRNSQFHDFEIILLDLKSKIRNFNLYKIFCKIKRIYDFWYSRLSLPYSYVK